MRKQVLFTILMLLPFMASAEVIFVENDYGDTIYYNYSLEDDFVEVTSKPDKYSGSLIIPETVEYNNITYNVTSIDEQAFYGCYGLTSITIGNNVTSIGDNAFCDCVNLTSITIPNSVISIGNYAFYGCSKLTSVTIGNSVTSIGVEAFSQCYVLTSVTLGNNVTSIGNYAFSNCVKLASITIPNSVTSISDAAFNACAGLTSIEIPNSVTSIGEWAFSDCHGLTSITIGNGVKTISDYAFYDCDKLTTVNFGNSVTHIGKQVFFRCTGLTSVEIPNNVTSIGTNAFLYCTNLTSVTIGNGVKSIGKQAFSSCNRLSRIEVLATEPPYIENETKDNPTFGETVDGENEIYKYVYVHVPKGSIEAYSSAFGWRYFTRFKEDMEMNGNRYFVKLNVTDSSNGYVEQYVKVDESYTVAFGKKRKAIKKVEFNGEEVTNQIKDNTYTTPVLKEDSEIRVEYDEVEGDMNGDGVVSVTDVGILITNILNAK